jgi:predicted permease
MSWYKRLLDTVRPSRLDTELDEEMRFHLDMRSAAYEREGLSPDDARRRALRRFGSPVHVRETAREIHVIAWLDSVRQDLWLGFRLLRRSPVLTAASVVSLGLGIGATTGVFAVGDALMVRPLPVHRPADLVILQWRSTEWPKIGIWGTNDDNGHSWSFSYPMAERLAQVPGLDLAGVQEMHSAITGIRGEAGTADGSLVTGSYFRVLGVKPVAGRLLADADNSLAAPPAVVISHRFWQRSFGGDPTAVGSAIRVNGQVFTVVGVASRDFFGTLPGHWSDFYVPACWIGRLLPDFAAESPLASETFWWLQLFGRPRPGADLPAVHQTLAARFAAGVKPLITERKQYATFSMRSGARGFGFQLEDAVKPVTILMALVSLVLLIACANVANLLLARASARRKEAAMRLALGAGRLRVVRQHLTESLVLAAISGLAGSFFARWFAAAVLSLAPERTSLALDLGVSWRVVAFSVALSIVAGLAIGLAPAIALARSSVAQSMRAGLTVRTGWTHRVGLGRPLVALQIALSLLVLVVAGLFVKSLSNLESVPLGFNPEGVLLFTLDPVAAGYTPVQKLQATERIAARLRRVQGVKAVTWSSFALLEGIGWNTMVQVDGESAKQRPPCNLLGVEPTFHRTLQIPLVAGRLFDERDGATAPRVAIVSQSFVATYLKGASAVGRTFTAELERTPLVFEIVGVVRDAKYARLRREVSPVAYFPDAQQAIPMGPTFALKIDGAPKRATEDIRRIVHELEPTVPVVRIRTYAEQINEQLSMERSLSLLSAAFGVVALALAGIGLYGVVAFAVARRTAEMGIRLALGASRGTVLTLVLLDSAKVILPGACIGILAALAVTRMLESVLYGLTPTDPTTIAAATALLLAVASLAASIPARRAASVDPVEALRCE